MAGRIAYAVLRDWHRASQGNPPFVSPSFRFFQDLIVFLEALRLYRTQP
jgi:hypothetical protein